MPTRRFALSVLLGTCLALDGFGGLHAQGPAQGAQTSDASIFAPLTLAPAPSQTRLANGAPGPKYWQNRADYDLKATFDPQTGIMRGTMTLRYTNNSPNTLDSLWVQTEQPKGEVGQFTQLVNGKPVPVKLERLASTELTQSVVTLAEPLKPGATAALQGTWTVDMNSPYGGRMGRDGSLFEFAQWYPRTNVYDDVKGWNTEPYSTGAEFFLDYGDYTLEVTLPATYIVAATGTLSNPNDVLTPTEIARLAAAAKADTVVRVVTAAELASGDARPTKDGMLTWKFQAKNVRDMVWCAAPDYEWDATNWKGTLAQAYYRPKTANTWDEGADMARMSIQEYSERWFQYPYPQISVVEGPIEGMEYPMLSMVAQTATKPDLYEVITHEVGHNWFPMIVGSNERVHTWMDEGFNQFINSFSSARRYPTMGDQNARVSQYLQFVERTEQAGRDRPLETGQVIGNDGPQYFKTAAVLQMLRRDVMGPEAFDRGLRTYIQRWAYKHPTPMDFFRTMSDAAGKNLDWYWREWFLSATPVDQAVDSVSQTTQGSATAVTVTYGNKAKGVMPLLVRFTFSDNSTQDFTYPVDVWQKNVAAYRESYTFTGKTVTKVAIDPDQHLVDENRQNNVWTSPAK